MKKLLIILLLLFGLSFSSEAQENYDHLIFPDPGEKIILVTSDGQRSDFLSGLKIAEKEPFAIKIMAELNFTYHQSVLKLNQCSRNLSDNKQGPNVLFLSTNEGGFPRHGLRLTDKSNTVYYPELNYVDLVLDERRLKDGALHIFSHELGHVMMNNIWANFGEDAEKRMSPKQHASMGVTDYYTAFYEGWGIHFQRLAHEVSFYKDTFNQNYDHDRIMNSFWHSNIDRELRLNAVFQNNFIYEKLLPQGIDQNNLSLEELILLEHTSPIFDKTRLKNAQQMLASEGVIATLFYKINTNKILQNNYQDKEFYEHFLLKPIPPDVKPEDIFTPFENVMLKNYWLWQQLSKKDLKNAPVFTEYLKEWGNSFPTDKSEIIKLFIVLTVGKTVSNELQEKYEKMIFNGLIGDIQNFRKFSQEYVISLREMLDKVIQNELTIDANIGPELWVENPDFMIRRTLWVPQQKNHLTVNINTASVYELAAIFDINLETAKTLLKKRNEIGYFESLSQVQNFLNTLR